MAGDGKVCKLPHCEQSASADRSQGSSPGYDVEGAGPADGVLKVGSTGGLQ